MAARDNLRKNTVWLRILDDTYSNQLIKYIDLRLSIAVLLAFVGIQSRANSIIWINPIGGNWSGGSNWSSGVVPGQHDTAVITNIGEYNVYLDVDATVAGLVVGAQYGPYMQSFYTSGQTLTVNGLILVNSHGIFNLDGGGLAGTNELAGDSTGSGPMVWSGGDMSGSLTVGEQSILSISGGGIVGFAGLLLTNLGTVNWTNVGIYSYGPSNAQIYNIGSWNEQGDDSFTGGYDGGTTLFENIGTFSKSGALGVTTLDANVVFDNIGTVDIQSGTLDIAAGANNGGAFATGAGAFVNFTTPNYTFVNKTIFTGIGSALTSGATFGGTIVGTLNSVGGALTGVLTVAADGILNIEGGGNVGFAGLVLTNNGAVNWTNAGIYSYGPSNAQIYNHGVWNAESDNTFTGGYDGGTTLFDNFGSFLKSGHSGLTALDANVVFNNTGLVTVESGTLALGEGVNSGSGSFSTVSGAVLALDGMTIANSADLSGSGAVEMTGDTTIDGVLTAPHLQLVSGTLSGTNVLIGTLAWSGGYITGNMTVASNSVLNIVGGGNVGFAGLVLTNLGTVDWTNASIYSYAPGNAQIYNYGVWNAQGDDSFTGGYDGGFTLFDNFGTFLKSGNTGATTLDDNVEFNNAGLFNVQSGTLLIGGTGTSSGGDLATSGSGTIQFSSYSFANTNTFFGLGSYLTSGATFGGTIVGTLNWVGGALSGVLTIATNGVLSIAGGGNVGFTGLILTNNGAVHWTNAGIYSYGPSNAQIYNHGFWNAEGDDSFTGGYDGGTTLFDNVGTFLKSGNSGLTTLDANVVFNNSGILDSESGDISLQGAVDLTNGTINFGVNGLTNYGTVTLAGAVSLTGAISANLNDGFQPAIGDSFTNLYYGSFTGAFASAALPFADAWSTNYDPGYFVLTVLNTRPIFVTSSTNWHTVDELATLTESNTATDRESPPQSLTYSLVAGPNGMVVNPTTGILTWTPQQTNSPSTNLVMVGVMDNGTPALSATNAFSVIVVEVNIAPVLPSSSVKSIIVQHPSTITNGATEPNIHSVTAGYLLLAPPAGASINSNGVITWTPAQNQSLTTNTITTVVSNSNPYDLVNPHLSSTNTITVTVVPNTGATNVTVFRSANSVTLSWPADHAGFRLEAQTNALGTNWVVIPGSSATNLEIIPISLADEAVFFRLIYP